MYQKYDRSACVYTLVCLLAGWLAPGPSALGQFTITGVSDKAAPYVDTVTFSIGVQSGFAYGASLNQVPIPVGVPITVNTPDFYELRVAATNVFTSAVSNRYVRFIVRSAERGSTEWGLPPHTPLPVIPSSAEEFVGARLRILAPADFPAGYELPVVTWVVNGDGHAVRANGALEAAGQRSIAFKRGVGSGFLASTNPVGLLNYEASVGGLSTNKPINIEPEPAWNTVSGSLNGANVWPAGARIRVTSHLSVSNGVSLTIGAGAIVLLNPGVNIMNAGTITINGTVDRPVVFMPVARNQPWGGFFMRASTGVLDATGTIFTGSGADPNGGAGHRSEQCLFLVDAAPRISLTDSAAIALAGQFGHAYGGGTFTFTRFLLQGATTGGEYTGASFTVNDGAFIDFPDDSANFVDGDNDALYFVSGTHAFTNTLFGWTKDDGIDSGGSGYGPLTYQSCWFESTFHEGNSLSGYKNVISRNTVYIDCGQGIENGYNAPTNRMDTCLFLANKVGARHGDNYDNIGGYGGRETVTNSLSLFNHRDVFGFNWQTGAGNGWTNATGQMTIRGNWLSAPNEYFPDNGLWNPASDAHRLAPFLTIPPSAKVGVGLAVRANQFPLSTLAQGVPVRLSSFTTNVVQVSYALTSPATGLIGAGTLTFVPGETVKRIYPADIDIAAQPAWDVVLTGAVGAELTGVTTVTFSGTIARPEVGLAVSGPVLPGYRMAEGTFVRLNAATAQPVTVKFTVLGDAVPLKSGVLTFNPPQMIQRLLPEGFNPYAYATVDVVLSDPVGATLGASSVVRYENPALSVAFGVAGAQADVAMLGTGLPVSLNGPAGGPVSVEFAIDESGRVLTNGVVTLGPGQVSTLLTTPTLSIGSLGLVRAQLSNPVGAQLGSPNSLFLVRVVTVPPPTNTTLIAAGSVWRYRDVASAAPAGWAGLGFDDSGWPSGPAQLGFSNNEERDEATLIADNDQITSYFRHGFSVENPAAYAGLSYWLLRDDAGVVYLNGTEIFRSPNLPDPPAVISYNTTLKSGSPNGENTIDTGTTNRNALRAGTNVLAVEIHQQSATSSDVSFDFSLVGLGAAQSAPQFLQMGGFDGQLTIAWPDPGFVLEQADQLLPAGTVWTPVGAVSPYVVHPEGAQKFFRLRKL